MSRKHRQLEQAKLANRPAIELPRAEPMSVDREVVVNATPIEQLAQLEQLCETANDSAGLFDLETALAELRRSQRRLNADREEFVEDRERLERRCKRLDEREQQLDVQQEHFSAEQAETKAQRRRIAAELQVQRAAIIAERAELSAERTKTAQESPPIESTAELDSLRAECERLRQAATEWSEEQSLWRQAQTLWMKERVETATKLAAAEDQLDQMKSLQAAEIETSEAKTPAANDRADTRRAEDLQRRFELAVQDVRELKRRNAELEDQISEVRSHNKDQAKPETQLDWESQKRRLLASLEDADVRSNPRNSEQRLTLEGAIHITDEVVAQRDREIAELKSKLQDWEDRSQRAHSDPSKADVLDRDEMIQVERAKLRELQDQWREKLRQAEVDLSIERAKMARDKADIDEKLSAYAKRKEQRSNNETDDTTFEATPKPVRGRWLSRLGLKDGDS